MCKHGVNLFEHSSVSEQVTGIFRISAVDTKRKSHAVKGQKCLKIAICQQLLPY